MGKYMLMPKLDMSMEEGVIVRWIKQVGENTTRGDIVVEIETGKVSLEVDNPSAEGIILAQYFEEGDEVAVNTPIMYIGEASETAPSKEQALGDSKTPSTNKPPTSSPTSETSAQSATLGNTAESRDPAKSTTLDRPITVPTDKTFDYDLVVIGGGPGGYVSAIRAAQLEAKVALIEKEQLGGVCLNRGCIPTKALLKNAEFLKQIQEAQVMGIHIPKYTVDWTKIIERKDSVVSTLSKGVSGLLKKNGVTQLKGEAKVTKTHSIVLEQKEITARNIVVATGSTPITIPIQEDGSATIYSSAELLQIKKIPKDLIIIGGGIVGVEMASIFHRFGTKVTIVEMMDTIVAPLDSSLRDLLTKSLKRDGITLYTETKLEEIVKGKAKLSNGKSLACDSLLVSIGRKPSNSCIDALEITKTTKGFIEVNEYMQTNLPNIYAIGDVTGKSMLAHTASKQGIIVAEALFGKKKPMDYRAVPSCIFTNPEIATVGITEEQAIAQKIQYKSATFPFSSIGKALAIGETEGFVKVVVDSVYGEILGVHIIGPHASDLIGEGILAMVAEATYETIAETIHPHPTLSEALMEACEAIDSKAIHL